MNKIIKTEPKTLSGFMELLPEEQLLFNKLKDTIKRVYEDSGFFPLDTPIIELSDVLLAKAGGDTEKQIYRFNKGDNDLSLRFDLTVPLAKYIAKNYYDLTFPFKRYQIGKVYRGERPQRGRYREFYQADIDIIGDGKLSLINDAFLPSVIYNIFSELNIGKFTIKINNRKILSGFFESLDLEDNITNILRIIDKLDKIGVNEVKKELSKMNIDDVKIDKIINFINIKGNNIDIIDQLKNLKVINSKFKLGVEELNIVNNYLKQFNLNEEYIQIDLKIVRGLDYYTGTVYETFLDDYSNIGSICSGGRYDNLAKNYIDKELPGVGISIGITRLYDQLKRIGLLKKEDISISDVLIISLLDDLSYSIEVMNKLKELGIKAQLYMEDNKIKNKIKYATNLNIKYVIFVGDEEYKEKTLTLKDLVSGNQVTDKIEIIVNKLKNI
jgi:histidyl-tRNA synthetase